MYLQTDEQTIADLKLFGKQNEEGIYDNYNHVHTRGGEVLLEQLFRNPLADPDKINQRIQIIAHFATNDLKFLFSTSLFDVVEKYLADSAEQATVATGRSILGEKEIQNGVYAIIDLLHKTKDFIEKDVIKAALAYSEERGAIAQLLADDALLPALREESKGKLSYGAVTAYDRLFRKNQRQSLKKLLGHLYYLDVYLSVAQTAIKRKFVFPTITTSKSSQLKLEGVYHPTLKNPVANDFHMDNSKNMVFLTGANMAGKSTMLRTVSTALYIAHVGFPVAASAMEFSVLDGLYTTINLPDNLGMGASHFYAEVLRVKKIAVELSKGKALFVLFDELFRGTNVKDAHEATVAIMSKFSDHYNSLFIISSHIIEAGDILRQKHNIGFQYLPTRMVGKVPEYTYTLENGITDDRHGMIIIQNEKILEILRDGIKETV
ncbi:MULTISPECIES: MutS-related protein [unclassified Sphingobacterium]|uniref:MutS-related protein n=1 Tax=unclassified Sphingobacterium TaxID=2609468 RepID=UPI00105110F6|nr:MULTISPECIES: DNA mismatch repair protein [unclassified Sphingobacterium]MCS3556562.1 DNA mismatch repair ATPase MutS [Sphingobacterium sp. JUb21]TCQ99858.1 MutS-like protein [Sphingobacterium sp. JUb20]